MNCQKGSWYFLPQSQIRKNICRYLLILCYINVLLTAQVCTAHKTFEGWTESIPCGLIPPNQYWANKFILLRLISRPFRQEEFYVQRFFQVKMLILVILPQSAFSATSEILQWLSQLLRAFTDGPLHLIYSFHITNLENQSQISLWSYSPHLPCKNAAIAPSFLLLTPLIWVDLGGLELYFERAALTE